MASATSTSPLDSERQQASFDVRKLTYVLDGSEENTKKKELIRREVENDPQLRKSMESYFRGRVDEHKHALAVNARVVKRVMELGLHSASDRMAFVETVGEHLPISGLHQAMFIPTLMSQASAEQQEKWLNMALRYEIVGTYAQTELGHGSFLRGIETTATYDVEKQEFVINTPTVTASKWWPGGLGKTATHCVLMARLLIKDKDFGVHPFIVQIRSMENHMPLPGIEVGDIGPKFAWNAIDNGFLRFNHVRIPRDQMLMKYAKVSPDGEYTKPPHAKLAYGTMLYVRAGMVRDAATALSKAVTIATRYSAVRRQGFVMGTKVEPGRPETKILDYGSQMYAILPLVASSYALHFTGQRMLEMYGELQKSLKAGDFSTLPEVHATAAGLKAWATWTAASGIEECRQRCGGQGFLRASGLPDLFAATVPACTYEGDNNVMLQQTARFLLKALRAGVEGKTDSFRGNITYMKKARAVDSQICAINSIEDLYNLQNLVDIYEHKAIRQIIIVGTKLDSEIRARGGVAANKQVFSEVWNWLMPDFKTMVKAHCFLMILNSFIAIIQKTQQQQQQADPAVITVLNRLCALFALYHLEQDVQTVLIDGYFNMNTVDLLSRAVKDLLFKLRTDAVPLVDAFNFSDTTLNSAIGRYDGNVYEALYNSALKSPLNQHVVSPGYDDIIKPLMQSFKANL